MENAAKQLRRRITQTVIGLFSVLAVSGTIFAYEAFAQPHEAAQSSIVASDNGNNSSATMWAFIAAAVAFGLGAIGAGLAISSVGAAAMGAVAEKPEIAGQALIFVALAEGLVVFGFIMGLLILGKV